MNWIAVFIGGGFGSILRYAISHFSVKYFRHSLPFATLLSNILASIILVLALNYLSTEIGNKWIKPLVIIGFCGGFSTFSTFSAETFLLLKSDTPYWALINIIGSLVACIGVFYLIYKSPSL